MTTTRDLATGDMSEVAAVANATIEPGVTIGEGAIVSVGSLGDNDVGLGVVFGRE